MKKILLILISVISFTFTQDIYINTKHIVYMEDIDSNGYKCKVHVESKNTDVYTKEVCFRLSSQVNSARKVIKVELGDI